MPICGAIRGLIHGLTGGTEFVMQRSMTKTSFIIAASLVTTFGTTLAATAASADPGDQQVSRETERASKRVSLGAQVDLLPYGKIHGGTDSASIDEDAAFAYGVAAN